MEIYYKLQFKTVYDMAIDITSSIKDIDCDAKMK